MAILLRTGTLVVSVDLPAGLTANCFDQQASSPYRGLTDLVSEAQIPVTWGIATPEDWSAAAPLLISNEPHELAISGRPSWARAFAGRERFVHDLLAHRQAAAAVDILPTSVLVRDVDMLPFADLAQRRGVTAIRTAVDDAAPSAGLTIFGRVLGTSGTTPAAYRPDRLHYGLWDLKPSVVWLRPGQAPATRTAVGALRRGLERAIAEQAVFHLAIDATALIGAGDRALRDLRRFFAHADQRRRQTRLSILTMRETAERLSSPKVRMPSRSILRARAA